VRRAIEFLLAWLLGRVYRVTIEVDMSSITANWTLPSASPLRREIKHVLVDGRLIADPELPWSPINVFPKDDPQTFTIDNPIPGPWQFRFTIIDVADRSWTPLVVDAGDEVPFDETAQVGNVEIVVTP
jgi:hypothetical protein